MPTAKSTHFVDQYLPYLLARASAQISAQFHGQVKEAGLTVPQWRVLATLSDQAQMPVGELAVATLTEQSTLTKVLDRMQNDGLISRSICISDKRRILISSTRAGKARVKKLLKAANQHQAQLLIPLGSEQALCLRDTLGKLIQSSPPKN